MSPSVSHLLNRTLTVMREVVSTDAMGGQVHYYAAHGTVRARVSRSTGSELTAAEQEGAVVLEDIYLEPTADVVRNDFLVDGLDHWEVVATVQPSATAYTKAQCRRDVPSWPLPLAP